MVEPVIDPTPGMTAAIRRHLFILFLTRCAESAQFSQEYDIRRDAGLTEAEWVARKGRPRLWESRAFGKGGRVVQAEAREALGAAIKNGVPCRPGSIRKYASF